MLYQYVIEGESNNIKLDLYVSTTAYRSKMQCETDCALMIEEMQRTQPHVLTSRIRILTVR